MKEETRWQEFKAVAVALIPMCLITSLGFGGMLYSFIYAWNHDNWWRGPEEQCGLVIHRQWYIADDPNLFRDNSKAATMVVCTVLLDSGAKVVALGKDELIDVGDHVMVRHAKWKSEQNFSDFSGPRTATANTIHPERPFLRQTVSGL